MGANAVIHRFGTSDDNMVYSIAWSRTQEKVLSVRAIAACETRDDAERIAFQLSLAELAAEK